MQETEDVLNQDEIKTTLNSMLEVVKKKNTSEASLDEKELYDRIECIIKYVPPKLSSTLLPLLPRHLLKDLKVSVNDIDAYIRGKHSNFTSDDINNKCDEILRLVSLMPVCGHQAILAECKRDFQELLQDAEKRIEVLQNNCDSLSTEIEQLKEQSIENKGRVEEFDKTIATLQLRSDSLISDFQEKFNINSEKRSSDFQEKLAQYTEEIEELKNSSQTKYDTQEKELNKKANLLIEQINAHNVQAAKLVGIIAQTATVGHYDRIANREWRAAEALRGLSILAAVSVTAYIVVMFWNAEISTLPWQFFVFRLSVALPIVFLAFYTARESSRHRNLEIRNRQIALELATIEPYLDKLKPEEQAELRKEFAKKYFGKDIEPVNEEESLYRGIKVSGISFRKFSKILEHLAKILRP